MLRVVLYQMANYSLQGQWPPGAPAEEVYHSVVFPSAESRESNRAFKGTMEKTSFRGS